MNKKQKKMLARIILSGICFLFLMGVRHFGLIEEQGLLPFLLFAIPYGVIGWDIVYKALRNIVHGQVFDENFLMCVATFGAFGVGEYAEAVAVMLFYQVGELFQNYAVNRSRQSIADLMDICPEFANVERDGRLEQVEPDEVMPGDIIVIRPGERVPLDGVVTEGESFLDTAALTGESVPRKACAGDEVISGCVNGSGLLKVKVTKEYEDSTVAKILELVENAGERKAQVENFITKFARYYTPVVVTAAVLLAFVPPLILGGSFGEWIRRACIFLVISCPCALVISVPLSFFGGIGAASRSGILVKGSNFLEAAASMKTIVFDKTGTLTKGEFKVTAKHPAQGIGEEELLETAALAESYSDHPIARSIQEAYGAQQKEQLHLERVEKTEEISGHGVRAVIDGSTVLAGNEKLMYLEQISFTAETVPGTVVYLAKDGRFLGSVVISDEAKPEAKAAVAGLKAAGVRQTVMLTGDRKEAAQAVADELGIDVCMAELLPQDKVEALESLLKNEEYGKVGFAGDGINDAPVLTRADIGFAMGSMGSDAAIEAADIVLMDDNPEKIALTIRIARQTMRIVKQNITFALAVKFLVLILGAFGAANMWEAVFADVGVSVIAILNAMRTLRIK